MITKYSGLYIDLIQFLSNDHPDGTGDHENMEHLPYLGNCKAQYYKVREYATHIPWYAHDLQLIIKSRDQYLYYQPGIQTIGEYILLSYNGAISSYLIDRRYLPVDWR